MVDSDALVLVTRLPHTGLHVGVVRGHAGDPAGPGVGWQSLTVVSASHWLVEGNFSAGRNSLVLSVLGHAQMASPSPGQSALV